MNINNSSIQFENVLENRINKIRKILASKREEYSKDTDRYHNFRVAARSGPIEQTAEEALEGMMRKHLVSVYDLILMPETRTRERIDEKIGDLINYLILLEGIMLEKLK